MRAENQNIHEWKDNSQVQLEAMSAEIRDMNEKGNSLPIPCATSVPDTQICECGHLKKEHHKEFLKCKITLCNDFCLINKCSCHQFKQKAKMPECELK